MIAGLFDAAKQACQDSVVLGFILGPDGIIENDAVELTPELVQWLISKEVNAVGIDALGLGLGRKHGEYDRLLIKNGIFVIENLANLAQIPANEFNVYCFPLRIDGVDAIPARVVIETEEDG